ncbi:MAG: alpha/beta hydrolase [Defluviitaleaceae bacterium]|nr:alpha/beta hydrolase [Defluviitaleaceae bacterium]
MKNPCKFFIFIIKFTAIAAIVNYHVKVLFKALRDSKEDTDYIYNYRFGTVSYIKKGSGSALLLLHSPVMGGSKLEWVNLIDSLSRKYTVYAPDLPGFGDSAKAEISYSSYLYASFINDFIENVICDKAVVMASDRSADFALCAAAFVPENFKKLVLVSPKGFSSLPSKCPYRFIMRRLFELPLYGTFFYNMIWFDYFIANRLLLFAKKLGFPVPSFNKLTPTYFCLSDQPSKFTMTALYSGDLNICVKNKVASISIPKLVVLGQKDEGKFEHIETKWFPNVDTSPHLTHDTHKFIGEICSWIKK